MNRYLELMQADTIDDQPDQDSLNERSSTAATVRDTALEAAELLEKYRTLEEVPADFSSYADYLVEQAGDLMAEIMQNELRLLPFAHLARQDARSAQKMWRARASAVDSADTRASIYACLMNAHVCGDLLVDELCEVGQTRGSGPNRAVEAGATYATHTRNRSDT